MAAKPSPAVKSLVDGDAVESGLQAAIFTEATDLAENLDEDLLRYVRSVRGVVKQPIDESVDRLQRSRSPSNAPGLRACSRQSRSAFASQLAAFGWIRDTRPPLSRIMFSLSLPGPGQAAQSVPAPL